MLVVWTEGEKTPSVTVYPAHAIAGAKLVAARIVESNRDSREVYEICRAAGAQVTCSTPAVRVQLKALTGARAATVLAADAALEHALDDEANRGKVGPARAALVAAYLAP